ncbi:hypothetical protein BLSTO_05810 [Blastocystis sp. subtype 1]
MNGNDVEEDLRLMRELRDRLRTPLAKEELDTCIQRVYCCVSNTPKEGCVHQLASIVIQTLLECNFKFCGKLGENETTDVSLLLSKLDERPDGISFIHKTQFRSLRICIQADGVKLTMGDRSCFLSEDSTDARDCVVRFISAPNSRSSVHPIPECSFLPNPPTCSPPSSAYSGFDADRVPGVCSGSGGSLLGPQAFRRDGYYNENGEAVDRNYIPDGARFDPYGPSHMKPRLPPGFPVPPKPHNPVAPPMSRPNPDHMRRPDYYDLCLQNNGFYRGNCPHSAAEEAPRLSPAPQPHWLSLSGVLGSPQSTPPGAPQAQQAVQSVVQSVAQQVVQSVAQQVVQSVAQQVAQSVVQSVAQQAQQAQEGQ